MVFQTMRIRQDYRYTSYVLEEQSQFYMTGYRILKKQVQTGWIPCSKILYNGKIQLLYKTENYRSVAESAAGWDAGQTADYAARVLRAVYQVKEHGFLPVEGVDTDLSRIFVDGGGEIALIILPVHIEAAGQDWETKLRSALVSMTEICGETEGSGLQRLKRKLTDLEYPLERLCRELNPVQKDRQKNEEKETYTLGLRVQKPIEGQVITIDKAEFLIGKNAEAVDGMLDYLPTISRVHCKVIQREGSYFMEDLHSVNGTWVNGQRLQPGTEQEIRPGDRIGVAEVELYAVRM